MAEEDDLTPFFRYRDRVTSDPLRLSILAAHALIEELIELVIAEAVPHSECFDVPEMWFRDKLKAIRALLDAAREYGRVPKKNKFWVFIDKLNALRNAAAHRDYEKLRDKRFAELAKLFPNQPPPLTTEERERLLQESTEICAGVLMGMRDYYRKLRQGSQSSKDT